MYKKGNISRALVPVIIGTVFLAQSGDALAWNWHNRRHRPHYKKVVVKQHFLSPVARGLTSLYGWALLNQKCSRDVIVKTVRRATVVVAPAAAHTKGETVAIYIPDSNKSYKIVTLEKSVGWLHRTSRRVLPGAPYSRAVESPLREVAETLFQTFLFSIHR
ncbi:MAG: hypothetical protein ISS26_01035 [Candidatus Omnitrophica bacterium]|nr:hypothetical protein [Candidatus Omnitrophota bacterium]